MKNIENMILEHLIALRSEIGGMLRAVEVLHDRVNSLDSHLASLRRHAALLHEDMVAIHARLDRYEDRLKRVERCLELAPSA